MCTGHGWRLTCTERGTLENLVLAADGSGERPLAPARSGSGCARQV